MPAVFVDRAVFNRADSVFPLVASVEVGAFDNAAAGEAEDAGFEVGEFLGEVDAEAVFMTLPCLFGEKRYVLEVYGSSIGFYEEDAEFALAAVLVGCKGYLIFLPFLRIDGYFFFCVYLRVFHRRGIFEFYADFGSFALRRARPYGEAVILAFLVCYAEETLVFEACVLVVVSGRSEAHIVGISFEWAVVLQFYIAVGYPCSEVLGEFERAVLYHFCIKATVCGIVDVFEEEAVHCRLNRCSGLVCLDCEHVVRCKRQCGRESERQEQA